MRKKLPQILIFVFIFILIAGWVSAAQAITYQPKIEIPGGPSGNIDENSIGQYISAVYKYAIGAVGILATVALMLGGIFWITAGGSAERVGSARAWIGGALTGLVLVLGSYMILKTVNPDLIMLKPIRLLPIQPIQPQSENKGCCQFLDGCANSLTAAECRSGDFGGVGEYKGLNYTCDNFFLQQCILNIESCVGKQKWDLCYIISGNSREVGYCENSICQRCKTRGFCDRGKDYMCCNQRCDLITGCGIF